MTGCATPWIAENELFGAQTPAPWTATTAQYRANTLILAAAARRARREGLPHDRQPAEHGGEAAQWWRDVASVAVLVRQVYFTSPNVAGLHALGPVRASRAMRSGMRALVRRFTEIGIPANRVALELQFHSAMGQGGREGLKPSWKWFEIVKLQALAVRQVTKELGLESIWSWGWATFSDGGHRSRTRPRRPASTSGRGTRASATGPRRRGRSSTRRSASASSIICPPA